MELEEMFRILDLQPEMIQRLDGVQKELDLAKLEVYLKRLQDRKTAALANKQLQALFWEEEDHLKLLYCHLECARRVFDKYQEKHIPQTIYQDTMRCFPRFLRECKGINGRMFFDRGWWTYRQISMSIFRIGALEYELRELEGEPVIDLHIPSDADLSKEAVEDSFTQAKVFFQTYYGSYPYKKYTCNSWLLSPVITPMLSEKSHIRSFQKRFQIIGENKEDKEFIGYLFQVPENTDCKKFPESTSLQKKVKEWMLHGERVGSALGVIPVY